MTGSKTLLVLMIVATACHSAAPAIVNRTTATTVPPGYKVLSGPQRCGAELDCNAVGVRDVSSGGIRRIGRIERGMDSTLAIETAAGWFFEPAVRHLPEMSSHHQPHSRGYDLDATRFEAGALVVRLVESLSVFYPGQGAAGTSHRTWYERRCIVLDARAYCSAPAPIANEDCATERAGGPTFKRRCTGGPPPTVEL
jgi:hypothetical protein